MYVNELKSFVISDTSQKYEEINKKIIKFSKIYFTLSKNNSSQLNKNQNINNEISIKQLLDNQHNIIKELVKIINDILIEKINSEVVKKLEGQSFDISDEPLEQKSNTTNICSVSNYSIDKPYYKQYNIKEKLCEPINNKKNIINNKNNIINNKNNINSIINNNKKSVKRIKNNLNKSVDENLIAKKLLNQKKIIPLNIITPRTDNEFSGALSFLNININNKVNNYKPYKKFTNYKIELPSSQKVIKTYFNNLDISKNNPHVRTNNNNNNNALSSHYMNNNYTIDEEKLDKNSGNNEGQTSITSHNNIEDENFPEAFNKRKQKIKYRMGNSHSGDKDNKNIYHLNNLNKIKTLNNINSKVDYYLNTNSSFPNFNGSNSTERLDNIPCHHQRSNTAFNFFKTNFNNFNKLLNKDNKFLLKSSKSTLYSIPYINNGKVIKPSRFTKEIYNNSYLKITKYQKKRLHKSVK